MGRRGTEDGLVGLLERDLLRRGRGLDNGERVVVFWVEGARFGGQVRPAAGREG